MLTSIFFIIHRVKEVGTVVEYDVVAFTALAVVRHSILAL